MKKNKLKNNKLKKLKNDISFQSVVKILLYSIIVMIILMVIFDGLLNDFLAEQLLKFDAVIWYKIMEYKLPIIMIIYTIVLTIVSFFAIKKENSYIDDLFSSINSIVETPEKAIKLNSNLELLESELNKIRINVLESNNKARDEENKKNDLIMYMAHDLKTPLTSVIGYLTLLKEEEKLSFEIRDKYTNIALDKALRVEELTNQFFEITRYNLHEMELNKKNIDLILLLNQLMDECFPMLIDKKLEITLNGPKKLMYECDGFFMARAFGNLIKNAINYSHPKTKIQIIIEDTDSSIKLIFKNEGDKIPEYKLKRIFEKFYRADESRTSKTGGSGVGLSITKDIINLHGGEITVKNDDKYIEFYINMPK